MKLKGFSFFANGYAWYSHHNGFTTIESKHTIIDGG
jgi:hypothetical protein